MTTAITIQNDTIPVTPDDQHEYVLSSAQVAKGYGVSKNVIEKHKARNASELVEGKHWVLTICQTPGGRQSQVLWTKRGVVRLGFFIKSARAKLFRDGAEDLVIRSQPRRQPARASMLEISEMYSHLARITKLNAMIEPEAEYGEISPLTGRPKIYMTRSYLRSMGTAERAHLAMQYARIKDEAQYNFDRLLDDSGFEPNS